MKRFYVDTNIWLDLAFDRKDSLRPLGEFAFQFFKKCLRNEWQIIYSELVIEELGKNLTSIEIENRCFSVISKKHLLREVDILPKQVKEAENLAKWKKVPKADAGHAIIARDNKAIIVSRNFHFECLSKIVKVSLPEEI